MISQQKIKEWDEIADNSEAQVRETMVMIQNNSKPENHWFWHEMIKHLFTPVRQLAEARKHIKRLKFLLAGKSRVANWENSKEMARRQDILSIAEGYGLQLRRAGRLYKALCPLHNERTPSFFIDPKKQRFVCYGCGASGDVISLVQNLDGCGFTEAVKKLS